MSNRPDVFALQRADAAGVPSVHIGLHPDEERSEYDARLADLVAGFEPDLIVLAGWMRILTMSFLGWFPRQVINLHPALPGELPGTRSIERAWNEALAGSRTSTGVMVHLVPDDGVDDGPVLATEVVADRPDDTFEAFEARMHAAEHRLLVEVLGDVCDNPSIIDAAIGRARHDGSTTDRNGDPRMTDHTRSNVNDEFFDRFEALTFDDVVVVPGYSETLPDAVDTSARFAADIELAVPLVSAAMDKVTEGRMAVAMARHGGIGVIHRNMSIADQAAEVQKVKRSQSGMITDPVTLPPTALLHDAEALMHQFKFSGVPITDPDGRLVGILTNRDIRFCAGADFDRPVSDFMTADGLVTAPVGTSLDDAKAILQQHRIEKLPLVDADGRLAGPDHGQGHPEAARLPERLARLAGSAAVRGRDRRRRRHRGAGRSTGRDGGRRRRRSTPPTATRPTWSRRSSGSRARGRACRSPPATSSPRRASRRSLEPGADAVKVGVGAGSICTTRVVSGRGHAAAVGGLVRLADGPEARHPDHRRRRHHVLRRHRQGDRGRCIDGDARLAARRHRGEPWRDGAVRGSPLQGLPRHGFDGRDDGRQRRPLRHRPVDARLRTECRRRRQQQARAGRHRGSRARTPARSATCRTSSSAACGRAWATPARRRSADLRNARLMRVTTAGRDESHPHDVTITKEAPNYQRS